MAAKGTKVMTLDDQKERLLEDSSSMTDLLESGGQPLTKQNGWIRLDKIPTFVPAYEGLRGVAIIMTLWCHIDTTSRQVMHNMGPSGVTLFFVLSGFLITGVLQKQISANNLSCYKHLPKFYADRMVRLSPALLILIFAASLLHIQQGRSMKGLGSAILSTMTYTSNITELRSQCNLFTSTWSLAVEEQYYVLWSLTLPWLCRWNKLKRFTFMAFAILSSLCIKYSGMFGWSHHPRWLFVSFGTPSNIWKMLLGSYLRLLPVPSRLRSPMTGWFGIGLLAISHVLCIPTPRLDLTRLGLSSTWALPTFEEPIAAISASLIILGSLDGNALLELPCLRFMGRISYSSYLWQVPLLKIFGSPKGMTGLAFTALGICFASISTIYVEEPIRNRYREWKTQTSSRIDRRYY